MASPNENRMKNEKGIPTATPSKGKRGTPLYPPTPTSSARKPFTNPYPDFTKGNLGAAKYEVLQKLKDQIKELQVDGPSPVLLNVESQEATRYRVPSKLGKELKPSGIHNHLVENPDASPPCLCFLLDSPTEAISAFRRIQDSKKFPAGMWFQGCSQRRCPFFVALPNEQQARVMKDNEIQELSTPAQEHQTAAHSTLSHGTSGSQTALNTKRALPLDLAQAPTKRHRPYQAVAGPSTGTKQVEPEIENISFQFLDLTHQAGVADQGLDLGVFEEVLKRWSKCSRCHLWFAPGSSHRHEAQAIDDMEIIDLT